MVAEDTLGLFNSEIESIIRLASNTATLVTTIIPARGISQKCKDRLLMKTLFVTAAIQRTRTQITKEGDKLYALGDRSKYLLIPQDGVLSKSAQLFNQETHIVGRTCWAHPSINATSNPSPDALFQPSTFTIKLKGNLSITEHCPHKGSWMTSN